jgi:hypothetical protein
MTAQNTDMVLELLRLMRADISEIKSDIREIKARLASLESYIATLHGDQARTAIKVDDLTERVERLEKRAGLIEA